MDLLLKQISDTGPFGAILVLLILSNLWTIKQLLTEKDKRIRAAERTRDDLMAPIGYIKDALNLVERKITISKEQS